MKLQTELHYVTDRIETNLFCFRKSVEARFDPINDPYCMCSSAF